jgi:two-component system sensor histidine kinase QseC
VAGSDDLSPAALPADLDRLLHDLRGPLNAVVLHLEALKRLVGDDQMARASLQSIQSEMERMAAMLPLAFAVCALEPGTPRRLLVRALVESAVDESARKRVLVAPGAWPEVDGDERLLVLALRQLVLNALEASGDDGEVRVSVETGAGSAVSVIVEDTGGGFKTRNPNAIVRLMAGAKPGHAGVGLLIAQRVARLHGGSLAFETRPGGAVVRMTLR